SISQRLWPAAIIVLQGHDRIRVAKISDDLRWNGKLVDRLFQSVPADPEREDSRRFPDDTASTAERACRLRHRDPVELSAPLLPSRPARSHAFVLVIVGILRPGIDAAIGLALPHLD